MDRCLEISAQAMEALALKQDMISNNLANAATAGFRGDVAVFKSFPSVFDKAMGERAGGVRVESAAIDSAQGAMIQTGSQLDCAINGKGFFCVQTPRGERYTRNGNFHVDSEGQLVTPDGYPVAGESGQIFISGTDVTIAADGTVNVDGRTAGKIKIADFDLPYRLRKEGANFMAAEGGAQPKEAEDAEVAQGWLEGSNVQTVREMVSMVETLRAFEANQRIIQLKDEMISKAVNQVGKI
jgi:flagellar basal-body rod protein FlgG